MKYSKYPKPNKILVKIYSRILTAKIARSVPELHYPVLLLIIP
jgi:hypothetical protein